MTKSYQCENCKGVFEEAWTEEESRAEFDQNFRGYDPSDVAKLCDDCYQEFMARYKVMQQ